MAFVPLNASIPTQIVAFVDDQLSVTGDPTAVLDLFSWTLTVGVGVTHTPFVKTAGAVQVTGVGGITATGVEPPPPPPPPPHAVRAVRVAALRETSTTDDFIFFVLVAFDRWQFAGTNRKAALLGG